MEVMTKNEWVDWKRKTHDTEVAARLIERALVSWTQNNINWSVSVLTLGYPPRLMITFTKWGVNSIGDGALEIIGDVLTPLAERFNLKGFKNVKKNLVDYCLWIRIDDYINKAEKPKPNYVKNEYLCTCSMIPDDIICKDCNRPAPVYRITKGN